MNWKNSLRAGSFLLLFSATGMGEAAGAAAARGLDAASTIKRGYLEIPEGQVHYRTMGSGPVVMLMHQVVRSSDEYTRVMPLLATRYRVVAMDMLGFGESVKPPRQYDIPDHGRSVIAFMDAMGIERASFVGHHTGAKVSVEVAATHPERVDRMVLSALPYGYIMREDDPMPEIYRPMEVKADGSHLERIWHQQSGGAEASLEVRYEITLEYLKAGPRGEEGHYAAKHYSRLIDERLRRIPKRIRESTLLLCGREDKWMSGLDQLQQMLPESRVFIIEGSGTGTDIIRRKPDDFARAVFSFLNQE